MCVFVRDFRNKFQTCLPAESILDQRSENAREQFIQRVAAEASLVFVGYAGKSNICGKNEQILS